MKLEFTKEPITFDAVGAMNEINESISMMVDELSWHFQEIIIRQIYRNGNGSSLMKDEAVRHVKEISRKMEDGVLELEVGVDENFGDERAKIRTLVVLYGNVTNGPMMTKPGQQTWRKHVSYRGESPARSAYRLPHFEQTDVSGKLLENSMKEIEKHVNKFLNGITQLVKAIDFSIYLK